LRLDSRFWRSFDCSLAVWPPCGDEAVGIAMIQLVEMHNENISYQRLRFFLQKEVLVFPKSYKNDDHNAF
jgi:hypothetical protein